MKQEGAVKLTGKWSDWLYELEPSNIHTVLISISPLHY